MTDSIDGLKNLPLSGWFPWNTEKIFAGRVAAYIFQCLGIIVGVTVNASLDTLVISHIMAACWQIRLLKNDLAKLKREQDFKYINNQIINCIKHHLGIIKYISLVEDTFNAGIFFQFIASCSALCITCFQILLTPLNSPNFYVTLCYLIALTIQISGYCWTGQQLITESDEITTSCYNMDWWYGRECDMKAKTALFLMMERCKRPLCLRAGKFFTLSVFTLAAIFRTSYSFFAVLQRMNNQ